MNRTPSMDQERVTLVRSPCSAAFDALITGAIHDLMLCAPYIGAEPCGRLQRLRKQVSVTVCCDLRCETIISGGTDAMALSRLIAHRPSTRVVFVPSLHAKVYIADSEAALITSANMTFSGLHRNLEYGVRIDNPEQVRQISEDMNAYADLGTTISPSDLGWMHNAAMDLKQMRIDAEKSLSAAVRREIARRFAETHAEFLRVRAAGRAPHAIFSEAIRHFLVSGPLSTSDLHKRIQALHPDLCDDTIDRVIDGQHFGKKWKHAVRTAQQSLKKQGVVRYESGLWHLINQ